MFEYTLRQKVNPTDLTLPMKWYATPVNSGIMDIEEIAQWVARESTVSVADTIAVMRGLLEVMPAFMLDGKIIDLDTFGSFRCTLNSGGVELEEDWDSSLIKKINVRFRPSSNFAHRMTAVVYKKVEG